MIILKNSLSRTWMDFLRLHQIRAMNLIALAAGLLMAGCAPVIHTDYDRSFDFAQLKTYTLLPITDAHDQTGMLGGSLVNARVRNALDHDLRAKGFSSSDRADFRIEFRFDSKREGYGDGGAFYHRPGLGGSGFGWSDPLRYREHEILVMTISIYDAREKTHLLWRGVAEDIWSKADTDAAYLDALIGGLVTTIMQRFPPQHD